MTPGCRWSCCRQWTTPNLQRMALGKRFSREAVKVFCVVTEMKRQDKIVPEDMMVLIAIPTPRPDRAKRGSSTSSMYLWWQSLCFCTGTDGWKSYQPKLLQKWHMARVRNGTLKKDLRHVFRSSLFFTFLGQTWAENLGPWHWRLWNIAGFLQSRIRI